MRYTTAQLNPRILDEAELPKGTLALNITKSIDDFSKQDGVGDDFVITPAHVMSFTQRAWVLSPDHANNASLILATYKVPDKGCLILGAFAFGRGDRDFPDFFVRSKSAGEERRCVFHANPAPEDKWARYVGHYLPLPKQGEANPVKYLNFK